MKALIIGGNRFFGRHLVDELLREKIDVTILNRGGASDEFGEKVRRIKADRKDKLMLSHAVEHGYWDVVYDQVCYTAQEARDACEVFDSKTKRYVVTSSESIYDHGLNQAEDKFSAKDFSFQKDVSPDEDYQAAKRQMESVFANNWRFSLAIVRPSLVVGTDDYTARLKWHIDRIKNDLPIYFPSIDIRSDFIRSDQAGNALKIIGLSNQTGPINCTTSGSIKLRDLISMCEEVVGKKAVLASKHEGENHSPYGGSADKTMNTDLLRSLGFQGKSSEEWMRELIHSIYGLETHLGNEARRDA